MHKIRWVLTAGRCHAAGPGIRRASTGEVFPSPFASAGGRAPEGPQASQPSQAYLRVPLMSEEDSAGSAAVEPAEKRGGHRRGRSLTSIIMPRRGKGRRASGTAEETEVRGEPQGSDC